MIKSLSRLWIVTILIAWSFDFLFWRKPVGISFAIFITLLVLGGVGLSLLEKRPPAKLSLLLVVPLAFFSLMSFWRLEPFTTFINVLISLLSLAILAVTYRSGQWLKYSWADYGKRLFHLAVSAFSKPILVRKQAVASPGNPELAEGTSLDPHAVRSDKRKKILPILRGVLLALPVLLLFGGLLASADPIFNQGVEDFFEFLKIENLPENIFRLSYILVIAYILTGLYLHALNTSPDEKLIGVEKPVLPRFLGFTEAAIILGSVNLLFAAFVIVQFRYFFGGRGNINLQGYTYSEYARRGFTELVLVAFFSLLLFLALSTIAQRNSRGQRITFSSLGAALTVLVGVILVSAYQRLVLYEAAYGFTRLRTYTHVFMIWVGVLLVALLLLELSGRLRTFALASILVAIGFGVTINLLPVDGFIARQNILRAQQGEDLDRAYLLSLSLDAVDELWQTFQGADTSEQVRQQIGGVLACQAALNPPSSLPWQSYNISREHAESLLQAEQAALSSYAARQDTSGRWIVTIDGHPQPCFTDTWGD